MQSSGEEAGQWNDADALAVIVGKDDVTYSKSTALHVRLSMEKCNHAVSILALNLYVNSSCL